MKPASRFLPLRYHALALGRTLQVIYWDACDWIMSRWPLVRDEPLTHEERQQICDRLTLDRWLHAIEKDMKPLPHRERRTTW